VFVKKKLPKQLGLHLYAVSTHPDELVLEPPSKINPGSAYVYWLFLLLKQSVNGCDL